MTARSTVACHNHADSACGCQPEWLAVTPIPLAVPLAHAVTAGTTGTACTGSGSLSPSKTVSQLVTTAASERRAAVTVSMTASAHGRWLHQPATGNHHRRRRLRAGSSESAPGHASESILPVSPALACPSCLQVPARPPETSEDSGQGRHSIRLTERTHCSARSETRRVEQQMRGAEGWQQGRVAHRGRSQGHAVLLLQKIPRRSLNWLLTRQCRGPHQTYRLLQLQW